MKLEQKPKNSETVLRSTIEEKPRCITFHTDFKYDIGFIEKVHRSYSAVNNYFEYSPVIPKIKFNDCEFKNIVELIEHFNAVEKTKLIGELLIDMWN